MSVKIAYFLSDVSAPGRGNLLVVPGSHLCNTLSGRENGTQPPGAKPILASAGTAVVFDRRLWHARSENRSEITRRALFVAYTYRWVRPRERANVVRPETLTPVRRQLLGFEATPGGHWLPSDEDVPLRAVAASV